MHLESPPSFLYEISWAELGQCSSAGELQSLWPPRGVLMPRSLAQDGGHLHRGVAAADGLDRSAPRRANQLMINRSLSTGRYRENAITKKSQSFRWQELGVGFS
jgi:hypothetical protein